MAFTLFRILEHRLNANVRVKTLIQTLHVMDLHPMRAKGYTLLFERSSLTDKLQSTFGYQLRTEIIDMETMRQNK